MAGPTTVAHAEPAPVPSTGAPAAAAPSAPDPSVVEPDKRAELLGAGWQASGDRLWTTSGDATGFHVLVAEARTGYQWRSAATLNVPGLESDRWIGNACVTESGNRAVVVYAPRNFTNREVLAGRGGYTAIVDLATGAVRNLDVRTSLAYFNPGCGSGEQVALTQEGDLDLGQTRILTLDAATGETAAPIDVPGQLTSVVPTDFGLVGADAGAVVTIDRKGARRKLAETSGVPFSLSADASGGVVYQEKAGTQAQVRRATVSGSGAKRKVDVRTLATGGAADFGIARAASGKVFIVGEPAKVKGLPATVGRLTAPTDTTVSTRGETVVTSQERADGADPRTAPVDPETAVPVSIDALSTKTGKALSFTVDAAAATAAASDAEPTWDPNGYCSVERNNPELQVYQPKPKQIEWAANQLVKGTLAITRKAGWHHNGLDAYNPVTMFPTPALTGGGKVPAQVMLGIMGQESNLWQASGNTLPGEYGNPLIGNYYGVDREKGAVDWDITWDKADCGYGVSQTTDGMRKASHPKPNEKILSHDKQVAVATDYVANAAAGLQILISKWNQMQAEGLRVNNNDPSKIENWFLAAWAYNAGYHPAGEADTNGAYGLGWGNNPANPRYRANRKLFGLDPKDFADPQDWGYPEKIIGFAALPPSVLESNNPTDVYVPLFRPAWWNGRDDIWPIPSERASYRREHATPATDTFCTADNDCEWGAEHLPTYEGNGMPGTNVLGEEAGPCAHRATNGKFDLKCWWHKPVTWKSDCATTCGNEFIRYDSTYASKEPEDGNSNPPVCSITDKPSGLLVVDDLPNSMEPVRQDCARPANAGTFDLSFGKDAKGNETSKVDLHQLGSGFGSHFWFGHTRKDDPGLQKMKITGTWRFNQSLDQWARVYVHIPDHGAHTREAKYVIDTGQGTRHRTVQQRIRTNSWVSLGSFKFAGKPVISLSTTGLNGNGDEDIAWDAAAVLPLNAKPKQIVAALGDSYSSGEGATANAGVDYFPESNVDGGGPWRNACHRSRHAWSRQMQLSDSTQSVGIRSGGWSADIDYHMTACSGATTKDVRSASTTGEDGQYTEPAQLDSGWVDADTTLVTLSIGGNDAKFTKVVTQCVLWAGVKDCQDSTMDGDNDPLGIAEPARIRNEVRASINRTLEEIHALAPHAKILLMGYPQLLETNGWNYCIAGIDDDETQWLADTGRLLNEQMQLGADQSVGAGIPVTFANPEQAFDGKGICGEPERIHGIVRGLTASDTPGALMSAQSFHPKLEGATIYSQVASASLRQMGL
ncbi:GDSL-type esterase/lipase family protein [Actinoplanes sp. CA-252034]|uniref:golvesin C-terminal-like domain-containing protein n=1 Tax=Actinoplanes sp. CA-252034 TaxID=3239906 RepID=UPI003D9624C7